MINILSNCEQNIGVDGTHAPFSIKPAEFIGGNPAHKGTLSAFSVAFAAVTERYRKTKGYGHVNMMIHNILQCVNGLRYLS